MEPVSSSHPISAAAEAEADSGVGCAKIYVVCLSARTEREREASESGERGERGRVCMCACIDLCCNSRRREKLQICATGGKR